VKHRDQKPPDDYYDLSQFVSEDEDFEEDSLVDHSLDLISEIINSNFDLFSIIRCYGN
jgi:hypothetical protein